MRKIASVELLRFISAISVMIWHYQHFYFPYNFFSEIEILASSRDHQPFYYFISFFYNYGNRGVDFFFIISGFVFAYVYLNERKFTNLKVFFINRFARLYPLHFLTLIVIALLQFYSDKNFNNYLIHIFNDIYHFILNLFFVPAWGFEKGLSFNGPIWSVSVEIIVYFMFFFLIINIKKYRLLISTLIVFIFILSQKLFGDNFLNFINLNLINCIILFFEGVLVYYLSKKIRNQKYLFFLGLIFFAISVTGNVKFYALFPSILLIFLSFENFIIGRLSVFFSFLGNLTYGTYLWHVPIQIILMIILKINNYDWSIISSKVFFLIYLLTVFLTSIVSYFFYERLTRNYLKKLYSNF